ncbi:hypothetical protein G6F60_003019 [Rhizopus arrhizus]|nr:hypothetical protein G6F60_003019 [Rhizopus arrhizus]
MSVRFIRSFHHKRIPSYKGYWSQILEQPTTTSKEDLLIKKPLAIPFETTIEELQPTVKPKEFVYLKGKPKELPQKPEPPTNCCMSVWDIYEDDIEDYAQKKKDLIQQFREAGEQVPEELESLTKDPLEEIDPTMKAFLEMEKKLK